MPGPPPGPDIRALTGLRSSKPSWYAQYRSTAESLHRALGSLEHLATVLSATAEGAGALCSAVVDAAAEHLGARWAVLALADGALPLARPRLVARGPGGVRAEVAELLPAPVRAAVGAALAAPGLPPEQTSAGVVVPLVVDGERAGVLVAVEPSRPVAPGDLAILRIVGNQSAVALQSDHVLARSEGLRRQTERLYAEAEERARDLAERHRELAEAHARLDRAARREAVDAERHRIARELHDSVTQHVLSAGMAVEWCRPEVEHHPAVAERLAHAKELTREAVERLRGAIHTLSSDAGPSEGLPERLGQLPSVHLLPGLAVTVRVEGRPVPLPAAVEDSLVRIASECVFNTATHARARRAAVRLVYRPDEVRLSAADDGAGTPEDLRRALRASGRTDDGYHRGLGNIADRCREMGAALSFTRARLGGVRVEVRLALPRDPAVPAEALSAAEASGAEASGGR